MAKTKISTKGLNGTSRSAIVDATTTRFDELLDKHSELLVKSGDRFKIFNSALNRYARLVSTPSRYDHAHIGYRRCDELLRELFFVSRWI